jgi:hypothetical protein
VKGRAQPGDQRLVLDAGDAEVDGARGQVTAVLAVAVLARAKAREDLDAMSLKVTAHRIQHLPEPRVDAMLLAGVPAAQKARQLGIGILARPPLVVDRPKVQPLVQIDRVELDGRKARLDLARRRLRRLLRHAVVRLQHARLGRENERKKVREHERLHVIPRFHGPATTATFCGHSRRHSRLEGTSGRSAPLADLSC